MINQEYSELVFERQGLLNKKSKSLEDEKRIDELDKTLTRLELRLPAQDIIHSIRDAFKHIPPRT